MTLEDKDLDAFMEMYRTLDDAEASGIIAGLIERMIESPESGLAGFTTLEVFKFLVEQAKTVE